MSGPVKCAICGLSATAEPRAGDYLDLTCRRCGRYVITGSAQADLEHLQLTPVQVSNISGWIRAKGSPPTIEVASLAELQRLPTPTGEEKARRLFYHLAKGTTHGQWIELNVNDPGLWGVASAGSAEEIIYLLRNYVVGRLKLLEDLNTWALGGFARFVVTPHGWDLIEQKAKS